MDKLKVLYLKTTVDKYELPIAVADSAGELAKMLKTTKNTVYCSLSHKRPGWYRLEIEEDDGERV